MRVGPDDRGVVRLPSLFRLLLILALLVGAAYAAMFALSTFVEVKPHPIEQAIPPSRLK